MLDRKSHMSIIPNVVKHDVHGAATTATWEEPGGSLCGGVHPVLFFKPRESVGHNLRSGRHKRLLRETQAPKREHPLPIRAGHSKIVTQKFALSNNCLTETACLFFWRTKPGSGNRLTPVSQDSAPPQRIKGREESLDAGWVRGDFKHSFRSAKKS